MEEISFLAVYKAIIILSAGIVGVNALCIPFLACYNNQYKTIGRLHI